MWEYACMRASDHGILKRDTGTPKAVVKESCGYLTPLLYKSRKHP